MDPHNKVIKEKSLSPNVNVVDSSPLQPAMEKNRESLKIKLMVRRSANQLVEQGILPPLKTSPAIHEQKKLLERAKTGDLLKMKIQQRPNREELERRHILESHESHIDPSLADKYRMLEKAILVDQLNSKISHRPGPLELIEKNILHTNEPIERIVKEGLFPFKLSTGDFEDDSQSSEGDVTQPEGIIIKSEVIPVATTSSSSTPQQQQHHHQIHVNTNFNSIDNGAPSAAPVNLNVISLNLPIQTSIIGQNSLIPSLSLKVPSATLEHEAITLPCIVSAENLIAAQPVTEHLPLQQQQHQLLAGSSTLEKKPSFESINKEFKAPVPTEGTNIKQHISSFIQNNQKYSSFGKEKSKKKCKIKPASKIKAIKFHEYKGPPNAKSTSTLSTVAAAAANSSSSSSSNNNINKKSGETNYELIMQQQCLLEYLEGIYKSNCNSVRESTANAANADAELSQQKKHCIEESAEKMPEEVRISETTATKKPFITIFPSKSTATVSVLPDIDLLSADFSRLGKMKVSELKAYLKKLNLPVSGPKPLLIERLRNYLPSKSPSSVVAMSPDKCENSSDITDMQLTSSLADSDLEIKSNFSDDNDIVREQQRQIEELQRKLLESQSELEKIKLNQSSEPTIIATSEPISEPVKNENSNKIFQIIPASTPTNVLYDTKYQLPGKLSTVFVVGVAGLNPVTAATATQECPSVPMLIHEEVVVPEVESKQSPVEPLTLSPDSKFFIDTTAAEAEKSHQHHSHHHHHHHTYHDAPIVQDDINDVLEILLKNEKWNTEDGNSAISNILISDNIPTESTKPHGDSICFADSDGGSDVLKSPAFENATLVGSGDSISDDALRDFPMEIEENSNTCMQSEGNNEQRRSCFGKSKEMEENSQFNVFDSFHGGGVADTIKTNNADKITTNGYNGIKNSLIGNFDNGLFDTFKSSIMNNSNISSFLNNNNSFDQKELKASEKLTSYNGFDLFGNTAIETITENAAPMEIENILSYDLYQHDSFFNVNHNNNNYQGNSQNDSFSTTHHNHHHHGISEPSSEMFCDDDNLFDSEKILKW